MLMHCVIRCANATYADDISDSAVQLFQTSQQQQQQQQQEKQQQHLE